MNTKYKSKTTYSYSFKCPCGWACENPSYKTKELLVKLHTKKCEEAKSCLFNYTDTSVYTDKVGAKKIRVSYEPIDQAEYRVRSNNKGDTQFLKKV